MMIEKIVITSEVYDKLKASLGKLIKEKCDYCGCEINRDIFGLLQKDITCCRSILCLTEYFEDHQEEDLDHAESNS